MQSILKKISYFYSTLNASLGKRFVNEVAFSILDGRAELLVSRLVVSLTFRLVCRVALRLYLSLSI